MPRLRDAATRLPAAGMIRAMTDRAIPGTDGAVACPFIAFEDDRDARSTAPDHRHRCFAEPVPAPRALAHQDAYCLSPAFAVCPTFQDWARREAAVARPPAAAALPPPRLRDDDTSRPVAMPPAEREPRHAPSAGSGPTPPTPPRRPQSRDWAAPPPWATASAPGLAAGSAGPAGAPGAVPGWVGGAAAGGGTASPAARGREDWGDASRGLADSAAARLAGPDPDLPSPARPTAARAAGQDGGQGIDDEADGDAVPEPWSAHPAPVPSRSRRDRPDAVPAARPATSPRAAAPRGLARGESDDAHELFGPAWERPRRYEAYPSLRTRVGLPSLGGVPRLAMAFVALIAAAAFLFFVSPMLLGLGKTSAPASAPPSAQVSAAPTDTPLPTEAPAPTPFTYTVAKGDTLSGIAQKFGVTVKAIQKANPTIKNPDSIKIGDQITIPAPPAGEPSGAVGGASPSVVQGASAAP